jgi:serine/threonine-protein kinase HipA
VMIGNGDMHLKNWSLLYKDPRQPRLSPAYDFVPTIFSLPEDNLGLRLGGEREFSKIKMANFARLASKAAASERMIVKVVHDTVEQVYDAWKDLRSNLPMDKEMKKMLGVHMNNVKLLH